MTTRMKWGDGWEIEYQLDRSTATFASWEIPTWAESPSAGVIGEWTPLRKRRLLFGLPIWFWREISNTGKERQ